MLLYVIHLALSNPGGCYPVKDVVVGNDNIKTIDVEGDTFSLIAEKCCEACSAYTAASAKADGNDNIGCIAWTASVNQGGKNCFLKDNADSPRQQGAGQHIRCVRAHTAAGAASTDTVF